MRSRIGTAAHLILSLAAVVATVAAVGARDDGSPQTPSPRVVDTTEWFRLSFEPVRKMEAAPPRAVVEQPASQQEIQVPAPVQNLRRTDQ